MTDTRAYRCPECHRIAPHDHWATHPRQGTAICPTCWAHGVESMPVTDYIEDEAVIEVLRQAAVDTRDIATAERDGERIDGETMGFVMGEGGAK